MQEVFGKKWLEEGKKVLERIETTQLDNIKKAAELMMKSIIAERWVHTFGVGHAHMAMEEIYPRIGGFVGFHPIAEQPLMWFLDMDVRQFLYLERLEGYGLKIMANFDFDKRDTMWIFSFSGINPVIMDVALETKRRGMKLVATTSLDHSKNTPSRHSSKKRLFEVADIVLDCCVPRGDAMLKIKGLDEMVGPGSTLGFVAIINAVVTQVAKNMVDKGVKPLINPTVNVKNVKSKDQVVEDNLREYKRRLQGL